MQSLKKIGIFGLPKFAEYDDSTVELKEFAREKCPVCNVEVTENEPIFELRNSVDSIWVKKMLNDRVAIDYRSDNPIAR